MRREDPITIHRLSQGQHAEALGDVPDAYGAVLRVRDNQLVLRVEDDARHVVGVTAQGVDLPGAGLVHAPEFHLAIISTGDDEGQGGVEGRPVNAYSYTAKIRTLETISCNKVR